MYELKEQCTDVADLRIGMFVCRLDRPWEETPFPLQGVELVSDADEALCRAFDVLHEKNMYGRKVVGIERSTFLIGPEGRIAAAWRKVRVPGHAQAVLDALKAAQAQ